MKSWEQVQAEHGPALKRVVASYAAAGPLRDELAQEVALAVWRALPRFRGDASLRTYVLRIAHNVGLRHALKHRQIPIDDSDRESVHPGPSPEEVASSSQRSEALMRAIRTLPLAQRRALVLALEGLTHAEIGVVLDVKQNAVAVRIHRARARLAEILEGP